MGMGMWVRIGFAAGHGLGWSQPSLPRALLRGVATTLEGGLPLLHHRAAVAAARSIAAWGKLCSCGARGEVCRESRARQDAGEVARAAMPQ
jgi:hypothetical protein